MNKMIITTSRGTYTYGAEEIQDGYEWLDHLAKQGVAYTFAFADDHEALQRAHEDFLNAPFMDSE